MAESTTDLPLRRMGPYELLAPIAEGGMAVIYLGRRLDAPDKPVALKVIRPQLARQADFVAMFQDEATIASGLVHPHIIAIREVGRDEGRPFLAMELLLGRTLLDAFEVCQRRGEVLPFDLAAYVGACMASALEYAHGSRNDKGAAQELVHRDVNPSNIVLTFAGVPKLIDFGLAKAMDRVAFTAAGIVKGKLAYLAPEQVQGKPADRRSDIFSLGVTLWEVTTGRRLFRAESDAETLKRVVAAEVPDPKELDASYPPALAAAVRKALARDPAERFARAAEFEAALLATLPVPAEAMASRLAAWLEERFPERERSAAWERLAASLEAKGREADRKAPPPPPSLAWIEAWDNEKQRITMMHAVVSAAPPSSRRSAPPSAPRSSPPSSRASAPPLPVGSPPSSQVLQPASERVDSEGERPTVPVDAARVKGAVAGAAAEAGGAGAGASVALDTHGAGPHGVASAPAAGVRAPDGSAGAISAAVISAAISAPEVPASDGPASDEGPPEERYAARARVLSARAQHLSRQGDGPGFVALRVELALAAELAGNDAEVETHARGALAVDGAVAFAHGALLRLHDRRQARGQGSAEGMREALHHLEALAAATGPEPARADLLAERARRLAELGSEPDAVVAAWERALAASARHGAALWGLDALLCAAAAPAAKRRRAGHLARMAEAFLPEPRFAAWLLVERGHLLEDEGDAEGAADAFGRALSLDPGVGPVREACLRHASRRRHGPLLVQLLLEEAGLERDAPRAARLELEAARIAHLRLGDAARARSILEQAARRAPTDAAIDARVLDELVASYEAAAEWTAARAARRARLAYVHDEAERALELAAMAVLAERGGDGAGALADVTEARRHAPDDELLLGEQDRLLALLDQGPARLALWRHEAARRAGGEPRARAFARAARLAEEQGQRDLAVELLRGALVAAPGDEEALDDLARLLAEVPSPPASEALRARIVLYGHGAEHATDPARRAAYLERMALLYEEGLGEASLAATTYEAVLALDPQRRHAQLGLLRTARRCGDAERYARALLDEARAADPPRRSLRELRAVEALLPSQRSRAVGLLTALLSRDPACMPARALETRLAEEDERWDAVDRSLAARLEHTPPAEQVPVLLARARVQALRLRAPGDALASLRRARELAPNHPAPPRLFLELAEATGGPRALKAALTELAAGAPSPEERGRYLLRAAEIDELVYDDDEAAARAYTEAVACGNIGAGDRLRRVLERRVRAAQGEAQSEALAALRSLAEKGAAGDRLALAFELARHPELRREALSLVEGAASGAHRIAALRTAEVWARALGQSDGVAASLEGLEAAFHSDTARSAALWAWSAGRPRASLDRSFYERVLARAPDDRAALVGLLGRALFELHGGGAAGGDAAAGASVQRALEAALLRAKEPRGRCLAHTALGLLHEGRRGDDREARVALHHLREALRLEPSLLAALVARPLAERFGDDEACVASLQVLADAQPTAEAKAASLIALSGVYTRSEDERLGLPHERRERAAELLERALDADANQPAAAGLLVALRAGTEGRERLLFVLRRVLPNATEAGAVRVLGLELARIARGELRDVPTAIDALRRVLAAVPNDALALEMLAELLLFQGAYGEAQPVLEALAASDDTRRKVWALFELSAVHARCGRSAEAEQALRAVLTFELTSARALRALLEARRGAALTPAQQKETVGWLERLAEQEETADRRSQAYAELARQKTTLGDRAGAEAALVEAVAQAPSPELLAQLAAFCRTPPGGPDAYARALAAVVSRAKTLGTLDAGILFALAEVEGRSLGRAAESMEHAAQALALRPADAEARALLAFAAAQRGQHGRAIDETCALLAEGGRGLLALRDAASALATLESSLASEHRHDEALAARELRAVAGALDEATYVALRARRLANPGGAAATPGALERSVLIASVVPAAGRHALVEIAFALAGAEGKLVEDDGADLGLSARDRIAPATRVPLRAWFDRLLRVFAVTEVELAQKSDLPSVRVVAATPPWVVVPTALAAQGDPPLTAGLARALARVAVGAFWLDALPPTQSLPLLVAAARQVHGTFGRGSSPGLEGGVVDQERRLGRILGRREKKALAALEPVLRHAPPPQVKELEAAILALRQGAARAAFLVTGDLLATLDELRASDAALGRATQSAGLPALAAVLAHPLAGDVCRYALTREAAQLRRRLGSTFSPAAV